MSDIEHGGWTHLETEDERRWDLCSGGHSGGRYIDEKGRPCCPRCGRLLDLSPCGCGEPGHEVLSRSFCPTRARQDRAALRRLARASIKD